VPVELLRNITPFRILKNQKKYKKNLKNKK